MSAPNSNPDGVPVWMAKLGIKAGGYLTMSKGQLRSQQRPDKPLKVQVWATGMLHSPGYQGELATTMRNGKKVPLTPRDIIAELCAVAKQYYADAGIIATEEEMAARKETKEDIRRALVALENDGVALRTDTKGVPLRELSADQLKRLPSGHTRISFWLIPRAAKPKDVAREWQRRQQPPITPPDIQKVEVGIICPPTPPISQILKIFQIKKPEKAVILDPAYQKKVERAYQAAREVFLEVVNGRLPHAGGEVVADSPLYVVAGSPPEVAATRGAFERKDEKNVETTTTGAAPRIDEDVVVGQELQITMPAARKFIADCRQSSPGCTVEDILTVSDRVAASIDPRRVNNPTGVILTAVPAKLPAHRKTIDDLAAAERKRQTVDAAAVASLMETAALDDQTNRAEAAMAPEERESRVKAAEPLAKAAVAAKTWSNMTAQQRRNVAETMARRTLRAELAEEKADHA